jgi:hypothetical protein
MNREILVPVWLLAALAFLPILGCVIGHVIA